MYRVGGERGLWVFHVGGFGQDPAGRNFSYDLFLGPWSKLPDAMDSGGLRGRGPGADRLLRPGSRERLVTFTRARTEQVVVTCTKETDGPDSGTETVLVRRGGRRCWAALAHDFRRANWIWSADIAAVAAVRPLVTAGYNSVWEAVGRQGLTVGGPRRGTPEKPGPSPQVSSWSAARRASRRQERCGRQKSAARRPGRCTSSTIPWERRTGGDAGVPVWLPGPRGPPSPLLTETLAVAQRRGSCRVLAGVVAKLDSPGPAVAVAGWCGLMTSWRRCWSSSVKPLRAPAEGVGDDVGDGDGWRPRAW